MARSAQAARVGLALILLAMGPAAASAEAAATPDGVPRALPGAAAFPPEVRSALDRALAERGADYVPRTRQRHPDGRPLYTNRLLLEASPYLRQHAHNPVNWQPWGDEAFAMARALGRPVFVSIGYSTCHWCHVMEEESFDDPDVAELLNQHFVAIKVDREVRPDVDAVYMAAANALGERGGWPLNVFLTPEREPFFAGTYFPKEDRDGRMGFVRLLALIRERWEEEPDSLSALAKRVSEAVRAGLERQVAESRELDAEALLARASRELAQRYDPEEGGARGAPKFPASFPVTVLLRAHARNGDPQALEMAVLTLEAMAKGGIHDQLGGGFHRYATDAYWVVPHFEKMLYDNALLAVDYLEAAQLTGREDFADVVRKTLDYVTREMTGPNGGFYSATDADSANHEERLEEGFFFTWTPEELEAVLGPAEAAVLAAWYGVRANGPLEGRSVLQRRAPEDGVAESAGKPVAEVRRIVEAAHPRLIEAREGRPTPLRDEKQLAGWNGLMISAFARAGFILDEPAYLETARRAATFVLGPLRAEDGTLHRVALDGHVAAAAFLEDYAFVIAGLLDLYEATGEPRWLAEAKALQEIQDREFGSLGGYARSARGGEPLLAREVSAGDGAIPSGNSITALNLLRLAEWSGDPAARARATAQLVAFASDLEADPTGSARMLLALDWLASGAREIAVVGPPGADFEPMLRPLRAHYDPNRVLSVATSGEDMAAHVAATPLLRGKTAQGGAVTAYVCQKQVCDRPTTDPAELEAQLSAASR